MPNSLFSELLLLGLHTSVVQQKYPTYTRWFLAPESIFLAEYFYVSSFIETEVGHHREFHVRSSVTGSGGEWNASRLWTRTWWKRTFYYQQNTPSNLEALFVEGMEIRVSALHLLPNYKIRQPSGRVKYQIFVCLFFVHSL